MPTKKMNLSTLMVDFDTDSECRTMLEDLRWPQGVRCVKCNSDHDHADQDAQAIRL